MTAGVADQLVIKLLENEFPRKVSQVVFNKQLKHFARWRELLNWYLGLKTTQRIEEKKLYLQRSLNL